MDTLSRILNTIEERVSELKDQSEKVTIMQHREDKWGKGKKRKE